MDPSFPQWEQSISLGTQIINSGIQDSPPRTQESSWRTHGSPHSTQASHCSITEASPQEEDCCLKDITVFQEDFLELQRYMYVSYVETCLSCACTWLVKKNVCVYSGHSGMPQGVCFAVQEDAWSLREDAYVPLGSACTPKRSA